MITYDRLWATMKEKGVTQYDLYTHYNINRSQLNRLRHNKNVEVNTIDRLCNIEHRNTAQRPGRSPRRARYHSSLIDVNVTEPGDKYEKLPESFVIFITENDVLEAGLPLYHINRFVEETGNRFGDDAHIIYVNSQIQDETNLGRLMHDFSCTDPSDMNYKILADRVRYFKSEKEGVLIMCRMLEEMRNETALETTKEFALRLIIRGKDTLEEIAEITKLPLAEINHLKETQQI